MAAAPSTDATTDGTKQGGDRLQDYFFLKTGREFVQDALERIDHYHSFIERTGRLSTWKRSYKNYYLGGIENARLRTGGDKNQFVMAQVNHFANIIGHMLNNVTGQRPDLKARAANSDFKSLAQTKVANQIIEYYLEEKDLEDYNIDSAELSLIFGEAFTEELWDATIGDDVAADDENNQTLKSGDVTFDFYGPMDVARDYTVGNAKKNLWYIARKWENKWELAAKFPQYQDAILKGSMNMANMRKVRIGYPIFEGETDLIPVYYGIHVKSSILPEGRLVKFIESDDTIFIDTPLPHKKILHRIAAQEQHGTNFGYTKAFDLLPIQENLNMLYSIIASNQAMFGVQSLLVAKGSGIEYSSLQGGLKIIEYDAKPGVDSKPSALQLTATPKEIFEHIQHLIQQMETISGVNSVVRGQPEASLESGAALALVASQSIQFLSSFQQAYTRLLESTGTGLIDILKEYAKAPRLISLAGENNMQYMAEFKADDISGVDRVQVEVGNPLSRTTSGKLQIAQDLLKNNLVLNAKQYLQIIETGSLESLTEGMESELMLIKQENSRLSSGKDLVQLPDPNQAPPQPGMPPAPPKMVMSLPVNFYDLHYMHIQEHKSVVANLDARLNPTVIEAVNAHIQMHVQMLKTLDPVVAGALNMPVLNAPQGAPPAGPHPMPGTQPGGPKPPLPPAGNPIQQQANAVKPPNMPQNPMSHQPFNPTTGGL